MVICSFTTGARNVLLRLGVVELDLGQRSPLELKAEDPKRLANYRRGLDQVTSAKHMLGQSRMEQWKIQDLFL